MSLHKSDISLLKNANIVLRVSLEVSFWFLGIGKDKTFLVTGIEAWLVTVHHNTRPETEHHNTMSDPPISNIKIV